MASKRRTTMSDAEKLYQMLQPKPKFLIARQRQLIRHGELIYFSINTMSKKPRYFWLFNDCLLVTKRLGVQRFMLQIVVHLSPSIKVITMPDSPNHEFRLLCPEKGTLAKAKQRRIVMWGKNREHKELWLKDLKHCLWRSSGMKGPDPSLAPQPHDTTHDDDEDMRRMMKEVSLRDRNQGAGGSQKDRTSSGKAGAGSASQQRQARGSKQPQPQELDNDDDYENEDSDDETEGEQWTKDSGDPLISFDDDFSQSAQDPYSAQRGPQQAPAGVALSQPQAYGYGNQAYPGTYGYGQAYMGGAQGYPGAGGIPYNPYAAAASSNQPLGYHMYTPYPQNPYGHYAGAAGSAPVGAADAAAYYQQLYGAQGIYGQQQQQQQTPYGASPQDAHHHQGMYGNQSVAGASSPYYGAGGEKSASSGAGALEPRSGDEAEEFARRELMEAAKAVENMAIEFAASRRSTGGDPQAVIHPSPGHAITFEDVSEAILEGAQDMARASTILLTAATRAQVERGRSGSDAAASYHADPQWAEGLVSAARFVVAATQHLIRTANQYVESHGKIGDEHLSASAGGVSAATAQLLAAFRARFAGRGNDIGLEEAAKAINSAKQKIVDAARAAAAQMGSGGGQDAPPPLVDSGSKYSLTARQVNEIEAQARIIKLEKEAQAARQELARLRNAEYSGNK